MHRTLIRMATLLAVVALTLIGCGDDDDDGAAATQKAAFIARGEELCRDFKAQLGRHLPRLRPHAAETGRGL